MSQPGAAPDRKITEAVIRKAERLGYKALFITVDAPQLGRRERDMRNKAPMASAVQSDNPETMSNSPPGGMASTSHRQESLMGNRFDKGTGHALSAFIDPSLNWDDLAWMMQVTETLLPVGHDLSPSHPIPPDRNEFLDSPSCL